MMFTRHLYLSSQGLVENNKNNYISIITIIKLNLLERNQMKLIEKIDEIYKISIKEKDSNSINTLRLIKSAIKDKQISIRGKQEEINDADILLLLQTLIKQRKDSIEAFKKANRQDLIDKEEAEIKIIETFLPKQKNESETKEIIENIIKKNNFSSIKDMGKLMSIMKSDYLGEIDMGVAGKIAKTSLGK